jgi:hypothetical protein
MPGAQFQKMELTSGFFHRMNSISSNRDARLGEVQQSVRFRRSGRECLAQYRSSEPACISRKAIRSIAEETYFMSDYRVNKGEVEEDQLTASIEKSTSKIPSSAYLALALGAMAVSAGLQAWNRKHAAMFVGQWAAPFLILGIYNKLVKQHGSDGRSEPGPRRRTEYVVSGASSY